MKPIHGPHEWLRLPSPFSVETGTVLLQEAPEANRNTLRQQLLDESYGKPFVIDDGERRWLYFSVRLMQSEMQLSSPYTLALRYTQAMMSCLLFQPKPRRIMLIGFGGGSLVKFIHRQLPGAHLTAVDLDPAVLAWRDAFFVPPDDERLTSIAGDGAACLAAAEKGLDLILLDAFDATGFASGLAGRDFLDSAFGKLSGNGVLVINLAGDSASYAGLIAEAMDCFDQQCLLLTVPEDGNHILLAFRQRPFDPRWRTIGQLAKELRARHQLDFPAFAQRLEQSAKLGLARREALRGR